MNLSNYRHMDPALLYSLVNTKLRNDYADLDDLVRSHDIDRDPLEKHLAAAGFVYHTAQNQCRAYGTCVIKNAVCLLYRLAGMTSRLTTYHPSYHLSFIKASSLRNKS